LISLSLSLSISSPPVLLRRITQACGLQVPTILISLLYNTPTPGARGHACGARRPWVASSFCRLLQSSRHQPTHQERRRRPKKRSSHRTAETATATAPPECPDAVMVGLGESVSASCATTLFPARVHLFKHNDDLDVSSSSSRKEEGPESNTLHTHTPHPPTSSIK